MSPQIATVCWLAFVCWLFAADLRRRPAVSKALWIPLTWAFILGTRPLSGWPVAASFGLSTSMSSTDDYVEGSPFDRCIFLILIALAFLVLSARRTRWGEFIRQNKWICIYMLYLGLSSVWSDYPFVSFKRWIKDIGNVLMVLVVLTEKDPIDAVRALLLRSAFLLIPLSVLLIKYYPELGRYYDQWTYQPYFCGATTNKNVLGMSLFVCGVGLCWQLLELPKADLFKAKKKEIFTLTFLIALTIWLMSKAQSATAVTCTALAVLLLILLKNEALRNRLDRIFPRLVVLVLLVAALQTCFDLRGIVVDSLGRDLTFTGRTDIWSMLLEEDVNLLVGEGYYSFWLGDRVERLSAKYFYHLNEAHNGYLETYLNNGLIGLGLLLVMLGSTANRIKNDIVHGSILGPLNLAFLVGTVIYNLTEAAVDRLDLVWLAMLLCLMQYSTWSGIVPVVEGHEPNSAITT
jgi:exopolysaccharide production protein ExoQ